MIQTDKRNAIMRVAETIDCQVRRVRVNAVEAMRAHELAEITIDLMPGETLCPFCLGTNLRKVDVRFTTHGPEVSGFPFSYEWFTTCGQCEFGRMKVCKHCDHTVSKGSLCQCKGAIAERQEIEVAKEADRLAKMRHISPAEYAHEKVYVNEEYRVLGDVISEAEDGEDVGLVLACELTEPALCPDADDVIERIEDRAYEECDDGHIVSFGAGAKEALQAVLDKWFAEHCTVNELYYPTNVIIDISPAKTEEEEAQ
ncbi:MAG: hypothetical protein IPP12_22340 [Nitrospira sp.]|nr:hypothetical protein [Nitrospira sp.]